MKKLLPIALLMVSALSAHAAPPEIVIDPVVTAPASGYLIVKPKTDAASVVYVSPQLDPFPAEFLSDKTVFIVPVRGLAAGEYAVWAVGASKTGEQRVVMFVVRVGKATVPPVVPPIDPPPPTPTALYFAVVRADGPAAPAFTKIMSDSAWNQLRAKGHSVKDFTVTEASRLGIVAGTALPAVVTLRNQAGGSKVLRGAVPLPTTADAILKLEVLP